VIDLALLSFVKYVLLFCAFILHSNQTFASMHNLFGQYKINDSIGYSILSVESTVSFSLKLICSA